MNIKETIMEKAKNIGSKAKTFKGAYRFLKDCRKSDATWLHQTTPLALSPFSTWSLKVERGIKVNHSKTLSKRDYLLTQKGLRICKGLGLWTLEDALETNSLEEQKHLNTNVVSLYVSFDNAVAKQFLTQHIRKIHNQISVKNKIRPYMTESHIRSGRWSKVERTMVIPCYAYLEASGNLTVNYNGKFTTLSPPKFWKWEVRDNMVGLIHRRIQDLDFHTKTFAYAISPDTMVDLAYKNREKRKEAMEVIADVIPEGFTICFRDSLNAGNCQAGTERFLEQYGLDKKKHYRPYDLPANVFDNSRFRVAMQYGAKRFRNEIAVGVSMLKDHR